MLSSRWSPLVLLFPSPPVPLLILRWLYCAHQLLLSFYSFWVFRSSKSPQVSRTLLSILANLNNVVVIMVSILLLISNSSSLSSKTLWTVSSVPVTIRNVVILYVPQFLFLVLWVVKAYIYLFFLFFLLCGRPEWQNPIDKFSFYLLNTPRPFRRTWHMSLVLCKLPWGAYILGIWSTSRLLGHLLQPFWDNSWCCLPLEHGPD